MATDQFLGRAAKALVSDPAARPVAPARRGCPARGGLATFAAGREGMPFLLSGFANGTMLATARGELPVDRLRAGDQVFTLDSGYQPILWAGDMRTDDGRHPYSVAFPAGSLGEGLPCRPLTLSTCHGVLLSEGRLSMLFGEREVLAEAGRVSPAYDGLLRAALAPVRFCQILLPRHEIVLANGAPCESLFADDASLAELPSAVRRHVLALAGDGRGHSARLRFTGGEAALALRHLSVSGPSAAA